jgi:hypothetical protein
MPMTSVVLSPDTFSTCRLTWPSASSTASKNTASTSLPVRLCLGHRCRSVLTWPSKRSRSQEENPQGPGCAHHVRHEGQICHRKTPGRAGHLRCQSPMIGHHQQKAGRGVSQRQITEQALGRQGGHDPKVPCHLWAWSFSLIAALPDHMTIRACSRPISAVCSQLEIGNRNTLRNSCLWRR